MINKIQSFFSGKEMKTLTNNFISLLMIRGIDIFIPILIMPYLISVVGVSNYGKYVFIYSIIFYFLYLTQYGFSLSAVRDIANHQNDKEIINKIFFKVIFTKLLLFICGAIVIIILSYSFVDLKPERFLLYTTFLIVLGDVFNPTWLYQGMEKMKYLTIVNVISKLTYAVLIVLFIKETFDYKFIGLIQAIGFLLSGFISFIMAIRVFEFKYVNIKLREIKLQLKLGFSSFVTLTVPMLYANTSTFLLGVFSTTAQVAYFDAAYKVSSGFVSINTILTNVFYPYVNRKSNNIFKVAGFLITIGVLGSISCFILSHFIIIFLFGNEMNGSVVLLKILSLSPLFLAVRSSFGINYLLVKGKDKLYMKIAFISSIIGFLLGFYLINQLESLGSALVVVIAQGIYAFSSMYYAIKLENRKSNS